MATPHSKRPGRWAVLCIPGREDDDNDAWWYIWDRRKPVSSHGVVTEEIGHGEQARIEAYREARRRNDAPRKQPPR